MKVKTIIFMKTQSVTCNLDIVRNVSFNWKNVINKIVITQHGDYSSNFETVLPQHIDWKLVQLYPSCQVLDLIKYVNNSKAPINIVFSFNKLKNIGISIFLEERNKILSRTSKLNSLSYSGPLIQTKKQLKNIKSIVRITQNIDSEKDQKKNCVNYPTEEYESYDHCDNTKVRNKIQNEFGLTPFWITDDYDSVTNLVHDSNGSISKILPYFYAGTFESQCKPPCLSSQVYPILHIGIL